MAPMGDGQKDWAARLKASLGTAPAKQPTATPELPAQPAMAGASPPPAAAPASPAGPAPASGLLSYLSLPIETAPAEAAPAAAPARPSLLDALASPEASALWGTPASSPRPATSSAAAAPTAGLLAALSPAAAPAKPAAPAAPSAPAAPPPPAAAAPLAEAAPAAPQGGLLATLLARPLPQTTEPAATSSDTPPASTTAAAPATAEAEPEEPKAEQAAIQPATESPPSATATATPQAGALPQRRIAPSAAMRSAATTSPLAAPGGSGPRLAAPLRPRPVLRPGAARPVTAPPRPAATAPATRPGAAGAAPAKPSAPVTPTPGTAAPTAATPSAEPSAVATEAPSPMPATPLAETMPATLADVMEAVAKAQPSPAAAEPAAAPEPAAQAATAPQPGAEASEPPAPPAASAATPSEARADSMLSDDAALDAVAAQAEGEPEMVVDWFGLRTPVSIAPELATYVGKVLGRPDPTDPRGVSAEWAGLAQSVLAAKEHWCALSVGAGRGDLLLAGAVAARRRGLALRLHATEAQPGRFAALLQHCAANDIDPAAHRFQQVAVGGSPAARPPRGTIVQELLAAEPAWDWVHLALPGTLIPLLTQSAPLLTERVRMLSLVTHSRAEEAVAIRALVGARWQLLGEVPGVLRPRNPRTVDRPGVQVWRNPAL